MKEASARPRDAAVIFVGLMNGYRHGVRRYALVFGGHRDREIQASIAGRWRPRAAGGFRDVHRPKFVAVKGSDFVCARMLREDIGVAVIPGNDKGAPERLLGGAAELRATPPNVNGPVVALTL